MYLLKEKEGCLHHFQIFPPADAQREALTVKTGGTQSPLLPAAWAEMGFGAFSRF